MLSLIGLPPTIGLVGKLYLFRAVIAGGFYWLAIIGVLTSVISAYYYLRVVVVMYMAGEGKGELAHGDGASGAALLVCVLAILYLGLYPGPLLVLIGTLVL